MQRAEDPVTPREILDGMERGQLFVEYLPTMTLADPRCVGAEALLRLRRGQKVLTGGAFIPLIENTPLSGTITYWVIDTVAAELGVLLSEHADAHIGINVPPEILGRGGLEYAAKRSGLRGHVDQIILEITERGVPDQLGLAALQQMSTRGVRLALDDTMLSGVNLALLARCNFSIIKIDRILTAQLIGNKPVPDWIEGLRSLLHMSSLQIIAEGVETEYQACTLRAAGVQMAQGHLYSTALNARALTRFYLEHQPQHH
jgi:sensor c-di-GMP phosphodiesterase-like protein